MEANGPIAIALTTAAGLAAIPVGISATVYTKAIAISDCDQFALSCILAATGTPGVKIQMQQSYKLPATEGASDAAWVVPESISDIFTDLADKTQHHKALAPVPVKYIRFALIEQTASVTDTVFTGFLSVQKKSLT